ncbi:gamma carbonic anhydrase family protein [Antarctobacter sp.]|uniref:gamma carbonic anhydrase family protein n=1 Tax=Antarctobacter sp. TaxID=1872577 RepID=UPI003A90CE2A
MPVYALGNISPQLPEGGDHWIAPDANVIGNVILGAGCSVWFGATLRGDNEPMTIGEGTNIQENTVIHSDPGFPATIGMNCTVGHKAMLHGCRIGDGTLIGMGAIVLNGAQIGRNCVIGAGALVTEGTEVPDNSMVLGAPARVVRQLDASWVARLQASADHYQANMRRFRETLKPVP